MSVPTALLLAHPGHELVVHRFVEETRPIVATLTDGSGGTGTSRAGSTTGVLEAIGAAPMSLYGRYTDAQCYDAMLRGDADFFLGIADALAAELVRARIEVVAGDAAEGWNPVHDIWRAVVNAAVAIASKRARRTIANFDFLLFGSHRGAAARRSAQCRLTELDEASYGRKLDAASAYAELHDEVHAALRGTTAGLVPPSLGAILDQRLEGLNAESYRWELLRRVDGERPMVLPRVYELYGELLVAQGRYREAIRHEQHLLPIERALQQFAAA